MARYTRGYTDTPATITVDIDTDIKTTIAEMGGFMKSRKLSIEEIREQSR